MDERVPLSKARPFLELTIATKQTVSLVLTHQQASRRSFMLPNARLAFSNHRRRGFSVGNERETYSSQFDGSSGSTSWKKGVLRPSGEALKSSPLVMEAEVGGCWLSLWYCQRDKGLMNRSAGILYGLGDQFCGVSTRPSEELEDWGRCQRWRLLQSLFFRERCDLLFVLTAFPCTKTYFSSTEHSSWVGFHESLGPVIVSIAHTAISHKFPSLICTQLVARCFA